MARTIAKDHEEKRLAILKNAAQFFAHNGFDRSSMSQLAIACGVSKALIYHYYNSKDALLFDIVNTHLTALLKTLQKVDQSGLDKSQNLRQTVHAILDAYRDADAEHQVQTEAMTALPERERAFLADLQRQIVAIVADALRAVTPEIYAKKPESLRPVTMSLFGMLNWFYMWHRPGKGLSRAQYGDLVSDLILRGVNGLDAD
ncbi:MAG: TetR/AcrR family transcriptional regulator [Alphaproteobacteria bacterium]|nr:TetR/AcrR family transcriptional regulator [Alphaproteobacteria bacterium]